MREKDLIRSKLDYLSNLNEVDARRYIALWAIELGWAGISRVKKITGKSMDTIRKGILEVKSGKNIKREGMLRRKGGAFTPAPTNRIPNFSPPFSILSSTIQFPPALSKEVINTTSFLSI